MARAESSSLELHGAPTGNCLRVAVALEALGLDYSTHLVALDRLEHLDPDFIGLNPFGRVPVLVDRSTDGAPFVLTQSNAILLHLAALRPGMILPVEGDPQRSRVIERFFYFLTDVIAPNHGSFVLANYGALQAAGILWHRAAEAMLGAERFLSEGPFIAGDAFTLADIAALTVVSASQDRLDWARAPRLRDWMDRVTDRDDVQDGLSAFSPVHRP